MPFDGVTYLCCSECGEFVVEGEAEAHENRCGSDQLVSRVRAGPVERKNLREHLANNPKNRTDKVKKQCLCQAPGERCESTNKAGCLCALPVNHVGEHMVCGLNEHTICTWPRTDTPTAEFLAWFEAQYGPDTASEAKQASLERIVYAGQKAQLKLDIQERYTIIKQAALRTWNAKHKG